MKKLYLLISISVSIPVLSFFFFNSNNSTPLNINSAQPNNKFLIGATESGIDGDYSHFNELKFNTWHKYGKWTNSNISWFQGDSLTASLSVYQAKIKQILDSNERRDYNTIMDRPKIEFLAYGQRSDYRCESISRSWTNDLWFYSYDSSKTGKDTIDNLYGSGKKVKFCGTGIHSSGYVVKNLRANREQINFIDLSGAYNRDDHYKWFIKPKIRIDSAVVVNNPNLDVCKIEVVNWKDSVIKIINIKASKFANISNPYDGNYLEEFFFEVSDPKLELSSTDMLILNPDNKTMADEGCKVDYRVYWEGNCNMWIEYVRLDNEIANDLFSNNANNPTFLKYMDWFQWEVEDIANDYPDNINRFYIEEFEFNNIPCMSYVSHKLDSLSGGRLSLMSSLNLSAYKAHVPSYMRDNIPGLADHIIRNLVNKVGSGEVFMGSYPLLKHSFKGYDSYIPNTLPVASFDTTQGMFGQPAGVSTYEDWLQSTLDMELGNNDYEYLFFTKYLKTAEYISRKAGIPFIHFEQAHLWNSPGHKLREPTNEELRLMANLAVSYGAKGNILFHYSGSGCYSDAYFSRGLTDPLITDCGNFGTPRTSNAYGQNKWQGVKEMNAKLEKWGPYLMSFDTIRHSYIVRLERDDLINETYFNDILSYKQLASAYPGHETTPESASQRYLQAAVFNNPDESNSRYFMIVNRRCSPFDETNPDVENGSRFIKIKLDSASSSFAGFNNWSIYDLEKDTLVKTFSKKELSTIELGWILPGEGKLYKLAPVMQEGGTLVANEQVEGITFTCNGPVNNNGKDISILEGTKINFKTGAGITMNGGKLTCSNYSTNTSENVLLKGYNGPWNGIVMNNCMRSVIQRTRFEDAKNCIEISNNNGGSKYTAKIIRRNYFKVTADSGKTLSINNQMEMAIDSNTFEITSLKSN